MSVKYVVDDNTLAYPGKVRIVSTHKKYSLDFLLQGALEKKKCPDCVERKPSFSFFSNRPKIN